MRRHAWVEDLCLARRASAERHVLRHGVRLEPPQATVAARLMVARLPERVKRRAAQLQVVSAAEHRARPECSVSARWRFYLSNGWNELPTHQPMT